MAVREIDVTRGRHVVMGRCQIVDARGRFVGIEHLSDFESHRRVLEIWRGHTVPRPAVFWAAEVWRTCGPMDESVAPPWLDYDLCCRFSRSYRFHRVDRVLATVRFIGTRGWRRRPGPEALDAGIAVSRRYWERRFARCAGGSRCRFADIRSIGWPGRAGTCGQRGSSERRRSLTRSSTWSCMPPPAAVLLRAEGRALRGCLSGAPRARQPGMATGPDPCRTVWRAVPDNRGRSRADRGVERRLGRAAAGGHS